MTIAFATLLVIHGLIHLIGVARAFAAAWLAASVLCLASAAAMFLWPRWWWAVAAVAVAVSTLAIVSAWSEAKYGMALNALVLVGVVFGFLSQGPFSLRADYDRDVASGLRSYEAPALVSERDLMHLPAPVQNYLRGAGVVGRPRVENYRLRWHGRIRSDPDARWMPLHAEQYNIVEPASRFFYLTATMVGLPVQGYHRYADGEASMLVKAAALVPVASASGRDMTISETVTLFNDMCLFAPATLVDRTIAWEVVSDRIVRARFTRGGHTVGAELTFGESGELTNFTSDDRFKASADGRSLTRMHWSTPVSAYRSFGSLRVPDGGQARWRGEHGDFTYIELTLDAIDYNVER